MRKQKSEGDQDFSIKSLFVPFTAVKAVHFIIIIGFVVFCNSFFNGFVIDDAGQIVSNPNINTLATIPKLFFDQSTLQMSSNYYRPLPGSVYVGLHLLFDDISFPYHLIQSLFHIANAVLIFYIFRKFLKPGLSFFLAALFLIHPVNEETVVYIANLQDVLFLFFGLLSLVILQAHPERSKYLIAAAIAILFSILSKESGVLFILITWLWVYLFKRKRLLFHTFCLAIVSVIYCFLRLISHVPFQKDPLVPVLNMSFSERVVNIPSIIFYYIHIFFYPDTLIALHSWVIRNIQLNNFILPLLLDILFFGVLISVSTYLMRTGKDKKAVVFFLLWFLLGLIIHLQLYPIDMTVADHYFYFPIIGLLGLTGLFLQKVIVNNSVKVSMTVLGILLLIILSLRTFIRNTNWVNQTVLLTHDEKLAGNDYLEELSLGVDLLGRGDYNQAFPHIQHAEQLYPHSWKSWVALGAIYYQKGDIKHAKEAYLRAITIRNYLPAYEDAAMLSLMENGNLTETRDFVRHATDLYPNSEKLWYYRILAEYKTGNYDEALLAAKNYNQLKKDTESEAIYQRLLDKFPLNIDLK